MGYRAFELFSQLIVSALFFGPVAPGQLDRIANPVSRSRQNPLYMVYASARLISSEDVTRRH